MDRWKACPIDNMDITFGEISFMAWSNDKYMAHCANIYLAQ